jgi:hypothetical protein
LPDVLHLWRITWTRQGDVWVGPPVGGPEDGVLRTALHYQRIEVRDGVYVMSNPWRTLDRFTWYEGDVEITRPDEEAPDA